ncbi:MAG: hypothetical protein MRY83_19500 [Flavobacteriales bacterium]|nr:hypothetical protein [Flavobacteriales bacterium]
MKYSFLLLLSFLILFSCKKDKNLVKEFDTVIYEETFDGNEWEVTQDSDWDASNTDTTYANTTFHNNMLNAYANGCTNTKAHKTVSFCIENTDFLIEIIVEEFKYAQILDDSNYISIPLKNNTVFVNFTQEMINQKILITLEEDKTSVLDGQSVAEIKLLDINDDKIVVSNASRGLGDCVASSNLSIRSLKISTR